VPWRLCPMRTRPVLAQEQRSNAAPDLTKIAALTA
jgi:hypothetical protein